jgi:hypothetical protein
MINPSSMARSILATKSANVEHAREMGRRNRGPWTPERRLKMLTALQAVNAMSIVARRYYRAERRSRWLTNVIVERDGRKVFDLAGIDPLTGRRYNIYLEMPLDAALLDFLLLVMRCEDAPLVMRLDAAKNAAPLVHEKPRARVVVEAMPKAARAVVEREPVASPYTPEWRAKISAAIKRGNERRRRRSSHVTAAEAEPGDRDG